jgi:hypothetical protein
MSPRGSRSDLSSRPFAGRTRRGSVGLDLAHRRFPRRLFYSPRPREGFGSTAWSHRVLWFARRLNARHALRIRVRSAAGVQDARPVGRIRTLPSEPAISWSCSVPYILGSARSMTVKSSNGRSECRRGPPELSVLWAGHRPAVSLAGDHALPALPRAPSHHRRSVLGDVTGQHARREISRSASRSFHAYDSQFIGSRPASAPASPGRRLIRASPSGLTRTSRPPAEVRALGMATSVQVPEDTEHERGTLTSAPRLERARAPSARERRSLLRHQCVSRDPHRRYQPLTVTPLGPPGLRLGW